MKQQRAQRLCESVLNSLFDRLCLVDMAKPKQSPQSCVIMYVVSLGIFLGSSLPMGLTPCQISSLPGTAQPF